MSEGDVQAPPRARHQRPRAARLHRPAKSAFHRTRHLPSPRRVLAGHVIAWHNKHPLARRISRRHLGGWGVASLPFSPAPPDGPATGSGWAESTTVRFPMFDDLGFMGGIATSKVVALALAEGWTEQPGAPDWPVRKVPVGKGWDESQAERIYLLTACIKRRGRAPLRVLVGRHGPVGDHLGVVGHRVLSRPRMGLAALVAALPMVAMAWLAVGLIQSLRGPEPSPLVAAAPANAAPGAVATAPERTAAEFSSGGPGSGTVLPLPAPEGPGELLPSPADTAPGSADVPRDVPKVGIGPAASAPATRAAAPTTYRLVGQAQRDDTVLQKQAIQLQSVLQTLGRTGVGLRMDVVGTAEGDALAIGPPLEQTEAERVSKRLKARGFEFQLVPQ